MDRLDEFQQNINAVSAYDYHTFRAFGATLSEATRRAAFSAHPALRRYDEAFDKVLAEVRETAVSDKPAVWLVYNMGLVVKTRRMTFAIDLAHRQDVRMEPLLDFALVTHNHEDHVGPDFLKAMDRAGKTVVSNFLCNYGAHRGGKLGGGYTRRKKVFKFGDVKIRTSPSDHNDYLVDFTTAFEITIGDWTLYHTGDSSNIKKLTPLHEPDLWIVHPLCGLDVADGIRKFHPKRTVIAHLFELGHDPDRWRWSVDDGRKMLARVEAAGGAAVMPLWGERLS